MSAEFPAVALRENTQSLDFIVKHLSDPHMVKSLDDRVSDLKQRIGQICRERGWTVEWLQQRDAETLDSEAKMVLEAQALIEYLEYLRRGY